MVFKIASVPITPSSVCNSLSEVMVVAQNTMLVPTIPSRLHVPLITSQRGLVERRPRSCAKAKYKCPTIVRGNSI